MMELFGKIENSDFITHLENKDGHFVVIDSLSLALTISSLYNRKKQKILVVCPNLYSAQELYEHLVSLLGDENLLFFPQDEIIRVDINAYSKEMLLQRLYVMEECLKNENKILITHSCSITRYLPKKELFKNSIIHLQINKEYEIKDIVNKLISSGYTRVNKIDSPLQFALRGDILDIYPINEDNPIRIEFFDVEIESIRHFNISDQRSIDKIEKITITPANDIILSNEENNSCFEKILNEVESYKNDLPSDIFIKLKNRIEEEFSLVSTYGIQENFYKYLSLVQNEKNSIVDYFNPDFTICYDFNHCKSSLDLINEQSYAYFSELYKNGYGLKKYDFFDSLMNVLDKVNSIVFISSQYQNKDDQELKIRSVNEVAPNLFKAIENINNYIEEGKKVIVCLKDQYDSFKQYLKEFELDYQEIDLDTYIDKSLSLVHYDLNEGFELYEDNQIFLSKKEIYGYKIHTSRFLHRYRSAKILKSYDELNQGDYVVHEECGIGVFEEIVTLDTQGTKKDFLKVRYANDDYLYVPLEQFTLIRKYVSKEGSVPKLNKINGSDWKKTKEKIKARINLLADRLIKLYAERNSIVGYKCNPDDEFQKEFERGFPYRLTDDQEKAVQEIKQDMESIRPMDRLLCGDVGFGKTEVAFRAAFKAIMNQGQVALLCPTTLLCRQHYQRALERFSIYGIKIAQFSRFVPQAIQNQQIKDIKDNKIQFIIGTHRLLSEKIEIPNLRLLIVDEEQRFGVEHKERIKEVSKNIDVLTLSATPIPRTLQMSLLGIRSLSQIRMAPSNRMPIQTYVTPQSDSIIKEAIERELVRNGQVYYLHNQTYSMSNTVNKIKKLVKGARIDIVHGKMDREDIENVMNRFYNGEIDVLICTSIIETGLDISNVNTIIIENADRFGLAQLYQIKGRVGRSNKIAYAYLMIDENKEINEMAQKRLKAIKDFTELGSGFKIAQRDLTIRGAGDILGPEQAGFIDTVGIDMYIKLLNQVIKEKQNIINNEEEKKIKVSNINVGGYIPKNYATDGDKLEIYQEIQGISLIPELELYKEKIRDIYGRIPEELMNVLRKRKIDILSSSCYIENIEDQFSYVIITLSKEVSKINKIGIILMNKFQENNINVLTRFVDYKIVFKLQKNNDYLNSLEKILIILNNEIKEN